MPIIRYDRYPEFSYNFAGRVSTDYLKMEGLSWGINGNYKKALSPAFFVKGCAGYYRYSFTKLMGQNRWGNPDSRNVAYRSNTYILYRTDHYAYHTLSGNIGIEHSFSLTPNTKLIASSEVSSFFILDNYRNSYAGIK
jgi:hypothetical protein